MFSTGYISNSPDLASALGLDWHGQITSRLGFGWGFKIFLKDQKGFSMLRACYLRDKYE